VPMVSAFWLWRAAKRGGRQVGLALGLLGLSALNTGCALVGQGVDNVVFKAKESLEDCLERVRNRWWAKAAWDDVRNAHPEIKYSGDYADGFQEGFAEYLYAGGTGEPPPLPPRGYRTIHYQTPQGYQAIEEWFAGFRDGAAAARASGDRQWVTGPSSLRGPVNLPASPGLILPEPIPAEAGERLPPPREVPGAPGAKEAPPASGERGGNR